MSNLINSLLHLDQRPNLALRLVDRYLGIPLVAVLGLLTRKRREAPDEIRSIGLLGNAAIGDTVILSAAISDIRAALPKAKLIVFAPAADCATVCGMIAGIDVVVPIQMSDPVATIRTIRRYGPFDLWLDFGPWARTNAVVSCFAPASLRIGFQTPGQYRHGVYDRTAIHGNDVHEVINYRRLLVAAGIPGGDHIPELQPAHRSTAVRRIVMHVRSGGTAARMKMWPESYWVALIDHMTAVRIPVVLTGSQRDRGPLEDLRSRCHDPSAVENAAGGLTLGQTVDLLASSTAVVSVDTGVMHLAAALNCKLVALFGATSPRRWGPLNAHAKILFSARDCSPCVSLGLEKGCGSNVCMEDLRPEDVMHELETLIASP